MNTTHRIAAALAAVAIIGLASGSASAQLKVGGSGVDVVPPPNISAVQADPAMAIVRDSRRIGGQTLRCWQHGRLLYESAGFRGTMSSPNAISVPRRSGEGDAVTVFNLNDAFCMLAD